MGTCECECETREGEEEEEWGGGDAAFVGRKLVFLWRRGKREGEVCVSAWAEREEGGVSRRGDESVNEANEPAKASSPPPPTILWDTPGRRRVAAFFLFSCSMILKPPSLSYVRLIAAIVFPGFTQPLGPCGKRVIVWQILLLEPFLRSLPSPLLPSHPIYPPRGYLDKAQGSEPDEITTSHWAEIKLWVTEQTTSLALWQTGSWQGGFSVSPLLFFFFDSLNTRLSGRLPRLSISALSASLRSSARRLSAASPYSRCPSSLCIPPLFFCTEKDLSIFLHTTSPHSCVPLVFYTDPTCLQLPVTESPPSSRQMDQMIDNKKKDLAK